MVNNYRLAGLDPFLEGHRKTNVRRKIEIPIKDSEGKNKSLAFSHLFCLSRKT